MKLSLGKIVSLGIQHVLAMYAGAIIVPLIVGASLGLTNEQLTYLVSIDIFMCGVATILQVWKSKFLGIGLPVVLGCTFTAVGPMIVIGEQYGIPTIYGSIIISGLFVILIAKHFSLLVKFFPPVVTGSVVTIIGITLIPVAMQNMAGGAGSPNFGSTENILLSFGTLLFILMIFRLFKGFIRAIAILLGLVVGTAVAYFLGMVDFSSVNEANYFQLAKPFYFGVPEFHITPILTMCIVAMVSLVESTGVYFALADICKEKIDDKDLARGYRAEGLAIVFGGIVNSFPYTTFSQNVGLIQLSGVRNKKVIYTAGIILIVLGSIPKLGAITTIIPAAVLGGAMIAMFGMVIAYGIKMLSNVDFTKQENLLIMACSIGMGLGVTVVPDLFKALPESVQIITDNGIVIGSLTAIVLNIAFNMIKIKGVSSVPVLEQTQK